MVSEELIGKVQSRILNKKTIKEASDQTRELLTNKGLNVREIREHLKTIESSASSILAVYKNREAVRVHIEKIRSEIVGLSRLFSREDMGYNISNVIYYLGGAFGRLLTAFDKGDINTVVKVIGEEILPAVVVGEEILRFV